LVPCLGCGDEGASYTITHKVQPGLTYSFILLILNTSGITTQTSPIWTSPASSAVAAIAPNDMDTREITNQITRTLQKGTGSANSNSQDFLHNSKSPLNQNQLPDSSVPVKEYPTESPASSRSYASQKIPESGVNPTGTSQIKAPTQHNGKEDAFLGTNTPIVLVGLLGLVLALAGRRWYFWLRK
jgi:hypothetical protein